MNKKSGPKPFSYGVDLDELKLKRQKIAPPVAPKKYKGKGMDSAVSPGSDSVTHAQFDSISPARLQPVAPSSAHFNKGDNSGEFTRPPLKSVTPRADTNSDSSGGALNEFQQAQLARQAAHMRPQEDLPPQFRGGVNSNPKKQSLSFKVLQWMTETEPGEGEASQPVEAAEEESPRKAKTKGGRRNSEDDEMRFSGLHKKSEIPSKSFQLLQKYNLLDENSPTPDSKSSDQGEGQEDEETVGHYNEASIRYKGKHIPSPSFRVLKSWAELDTPVEQTTRRRPSRLEEEDDGMPETLSGEETVDKRYKGGNIPSRVFKTLQKAVGDDTPEEPNSSGEQQTANGDAGKSRAIKVLTKPTVAPSDSAVTDF